MFLEVYPDIIFILNFVADYILLFLLKKINRKSGTIKRRLLAAALGALSAVLTGIFPWMNIVLRFLLMNIMSSVLMLYIAFGRMKKADLLKQLVTLELITYFLGGLMNSIYYYTNFRLYLIYLGNKLTFSNISGKFVIIVLLLVTPIVVILLLLFRRYQGNIRETLEVELSFKNHSIHTRGLMDTGNCLYEPIFRKPVIIVENKLLEDLLPAEYLTELKNAKNYMESSDFGFVKPELENEHLPSLRIIPYQSIGEPQGMMLGLVLDKVLIYKGKETVCNEKVTAAICDNHLSTKEEYHVILHKELL